MTRKSSEQPRAKNRIQNVRLGLVYIFEKFFELECFIKIIWGYPPKYLLNTLGFVEIKLDIQIKLFVQLVRIVNNKVRNNMYVCYDNNS